MAVMDRGSALGNSSSRPSSSTARRDPDAQPLNDDDFQRMQRIPRVKTLRRALQLTQEEFSTRYRVPLGTLRDWEQGRSEPDQPAQAYLNVIAHDAQIADPLTKKELVRRVVILCSSFVRNLAYYRAGQSPKGKLRLYENAPEAGFWRQVNGNCIDMCVLEWCKLFGDRDGVHVWRQVVADPNFFEQELLHHLQIAKSEFDDLVIKMRRYRNKFIAHLDTDREMQIPQLDIAKNAIWFYHEYVVKNEAAEGDLVGWPQASWQLDAGYRECFNEARKIFQRQ